MKVNSIQLRITEIFYSLQGESVTVGLPTVFIRLTGCPLRCHYCDTTYAFNGGEIISIDALLDKLTIYSCKNICVTGGEPLAQPACFTLLSKLCDANYHVSLETSGARDIKDVDNRVMIVMDLKTPGSGESEKNLFHNVHHLKTSDQIKFVICSRKDYDWACHILKEYQLSSRAHILFSPSWQELNATTLANWIVEDQLNVRLQIQLHKILWGEAPGR